ncbi:hypothetical protein BH23VER1_BH23VER1_12720 [soil metagenome]
MIATARFLVALVLGSAAARADEAPQANIVIMGDSLTAGRGVDPGEAFPAVLGALIEAEGLPYRVTAAGVSGETSAGGLRRVDWILRQPTDIFVLALGANDGLRGLPVDSTAENLQAILDKVKEEHPDAKLVIAGMQMPANFGRDYVRAFRAIFPKLAEDNGATLVPFLLQGVAGDAALNQADRIHPNPDGHRKIAEALLPILRPLLAAE